MLSFTLIIVIFPLIFLFYASYSIRSGVYIRALCKNPAKGRVVSLTFDDGPDAVQTAKVLDVLKEYNVRACFFCIGSNTEGKEGLMRRIIDEGHLIGNHSYSHTARFPFRTVQQIMSDLEACEKKLPANEYRLFRPPFGVTNPMIGKAAGRMGYTTIGWNIRSLDTCSSRRALKRIKKRLSHGSVVLLHDKLPDSDRLLTEVIRMIRNERYRIVRLDELFDLK